MHWTAADLYLTRCNFVKAISSRAPPCDWGPQFSFYTRINITILCVFMFVSTRWCRQSSMRARGEPLHASDWRARIGMSRQDIQAKEQRGLTVSPVLVCTKCSGSPTTQTIFKKNEETKKWKRMTETFQRGLFILESTAAEDDLLRLICSWSMASISVNYKMNTGAHTDQVVDAPFFFSLSTIILWMVKCVFFFYWKIYGMNTLYGCTATKYTEHQKRFFEWG